MKKRIKLFTLLPLVASCLAATGCSLLDKNAKTYYFQNLSPDFQIATKKMKLLRSYQIIYQISKIITIYIF